jgi:UTP--glucose-1-phosphate uridylyltransferase
MIRKAVIPAAGLGKRLLPVTRTVPKEMLPLVDTPVIHEVVAEAVSSGITEVLIVSARGKEVMERYFEPTEGEEPSRTVTGEEAALQGWQRLRAAASIRFVRQPDQRGLADAVACAREFVGRDPFIVLLGDVIWDTVQPVAQQLADDYARHGSPVVAVERVPREKVSRYGIVGGTETEPGLFRVDRLCEKPSPDAAPSDLAIAARYALTPDIFDYIDRTRPGVGGEIHLADAMTGMLADREVLARHIDGRRLDLGNRLDYAQAVVRLACRREDIGAEFGAFLQSFVSKKSHLDREADPG